MANNNFNFNYPITRPYPYGWFKWVALIGAVVLVAVVSIFNLANNGYVLEVQYTRDPNTTVASKPWAQKLAAFDNKNAANCQSQNVPVDSQYYTNKLSMSFQIANIWQKKDGGGGIQTLPSLRYMNNPLENCSVQLITLDYSTIDRTAGEIGWTQVGLDATGLVKCMVRNEQETYVNLTVNYNFIPPTIESGNAFHFLNAPDENTQSSLWWAESLLSWYWLNAVSNVFDNVFAETDGEQGTAKGGFATMNSASLSFRPSKNVTDINNRQFFFVPNSHVLMYYADADGHFYTILGEGPGIVGSNSNPVQNVETLNELAAWPNIWISSVDFARVFYSAIMTDLGQVHTPTLLNDALLLETFSGFIPISGVETQWLKAGPARTPYKGGGNLTIEPSYLYTEYLCQVPTQKSAGSLILSLLVADIVFLQAAWTILNFITLKVLERNAPTAHYCAGCLAQRQDNVELLSPYASSSKDTVYQAVSTSTRSVL